MKQTIIYLLLLICSGFLKGQLIIDDPSFGGDKIPFQDTVISSYDNKFARCTITDYLIDLDQDKFNDVKFHLECDNGGFGSIDEMSITTFNFFTVHIDTNYQEHYQYLVEGSDQAVDDVRTTTVIKKYLQADTIHETQKSTNNETYLLYSSYGFFPSCVYNNIDLFLEDTSYIAFSKTSLEGISIYYMKIFISSKSRLNLFLVKTNEPQENLENQIQHIYPNPVSNSINLRDDYELVEIYSLTGALVLKKNLSTNQNSLNVSWLKRGFYIIRLKKADTEFRMTFVKQ